MTKSISCETAILDGMVSIKKDRKAGKTPGKKGPKINGPISVNQLYKVVGQHGFKPGHIKNTIKKMKESKTIEGTNAVKLVKAVKSATSDDEE